MTITKYKLANNHLFEYKKDSYFSWLVPAWNIVVLTSHVEEEL